MFKPSLVRRYFSTVASKKLADVLIVLGGPGAGKGTQCENLVEKFGFRHLSAGQLLRDEMKKDNEESKIIDKCIKEGQIVPSSITVRLLLNSINQDPTKRYLIDGFPRNDENLQSWEKTSQDKINLMGVLFIECSLDTMTKRIEGRAKSSGRTDDNMESLKKRFRIFESETLPVIEYYEKKNKVIRADGNKDIKSVSEEIQRKIEQIL